VVVKEKERLLRWCGHCTGRVVMVVVWCLENKEGGGGGLKRLESTKITSLLDVHFCIYYEKPL
jgi:hypothetical protein